LDKRRRKYYAISLPKISKAIFPIKITLLSRMISTGEGRKYKADVSP